MTAKIHMLRVHSLSMKYASVDEFKLNIVMQISHDLGLAVWSGSCDSSGLQAADAATTPSIPPGDGY